MKRTLVAALLAPLLLPALADAAAPMRDADRAGLRASELRARVYREKGSWSEYRDEILRLAQVAPGDENRALDLAEAHEFVGAWTEAMEIYDRIAESGPCRPARERAADRRALLRERRGNRAGIEIDFNEPSNDQARRYRIHARHHLSPRTALEADAVSGHYRSGAIAAGEEFSDLNEFGLAWHYALRPDWDLELFGRLFNRRLSGAENIGARAAWSSPTGARARFELSSDNAWREPAQAVMRDGLFDLVSASFSWPFAAGWFLYGEASWRGYEQASGFDLGDERRGGLRLARSLVERPYGDTSPLRYLTASLGYERSRSDQDAVQRNVIGLVDQSSTVTGALDARFALGCRGTLDLGASVGHDETRDLDIADLDLYGFTIRARWDVSADVTFFCEAGYASESAADAQPGIDRRIRAGLTQTY